MKIQKFANKAVSMTLNILRGCTGFDVGSELGAACRVTLGHVKTGEFKINANDNYALAA